MKLLLILTTLAVLQSCSSKHPVKNSRLPSSTDSQENLVSQIKDKEFSLAKETDEYTWNDGKKSYYESTAEQLKNKTCESWASGKPTSVPCENIIGFKLVDDSHAIVSTSAGSEEMEVQFFFDKSDRLNMTFVKNGNYHKLGGAVKFKNSELILERSQCFSSSGPCQSRSQTIFKSVE